MPLTNPLDDAGLAIWSLLESKEDFTTLFPTNTPRQVRSETTEDYAPTEDMPELLPADYPRCRVVMAQARPATEQDSSSSFFDVTYGIEVCTGMEQQAVLRDATWAIYRAMLTWRTYVRDVVTWNSKACIYDVNADGISMTDQNIERNRGTNQWIAVWSTTVRFFFATSELVAN